MPGRDQPGHGLPAGTSPTVEGSAHRPPRRCMSKAWAPVKVRWQAEQWQAHSPVHQAPQQLVVTALEAIAGGGGVI